MTPAQHPKERSHVEVVNTSLILRGILALTVGTMALAWPRITVLALAVLFAVYAFMASGLAALRAIQQPHYLAGIRARPGRAD